MREKIKLFGALFTFLFLVSFFLPLLSFADEAVTASAAAIPVPRTGIWFLDYIAVVVPWLTPVVLTLFAGGKVWAFLFSIAKPITMFTSTQLPNPMGNQTIKMLNGVLLLLNYISLNIFNDKNHDHPAVTRPGVEAGAASGAPAAPEISTSLPMARPN